MNCKETAQKKMIVLDASAVLHRAWHALPKLTNRDGRVINAVYGFSSLLLKILKEEKPDFLAVAYDSPAPNLRKKIYQDYKANRQPQPQIFYDQIPLSRKISEAFSIPCFSKDGYEADDIIATLAKKISAEEKIKVFVYSGDHDLLQIVDKNTAISLFQHGLSKSKIYQASEIKAEYGLEPRQLVDFKALAGDPSDNLPGAKGIGKQTAINLLQKFQNLEKMYKNWEKLPDKIKKILEIDKKNIFLFRELNTLKNDLSLNDFSLKKCRVDPDSRQVIKAFKELGFTSLLKRFENNNSGAENFSGKKQEANLKGQKKLF
jgi:DNA polymerase-1